MSKLIRHIDPSKDFWELNPLTKPLFPDFHKVPTSSTIMWALTLLYHPESPYADFSLDTKKEIVAKEYTTTYEAYPEVISIFTNMILTKPQRYLIEWEKKWEERQNFLAAQPYTLDTADALDKALVNTEKIWKVYMNCRKDVEQEATQTAQGGVKESASEAGLI